jgi:hypothetical protein
MFKRIRMAIATAMLPTGFMVVRDYSKSVHYITFEKDRDYVLIEG